MPEAFRAVFRNARATSLYVSVALLSSIARLGVTHALTGGEVPEDPGMKLRLAMLGMDVGLAAAWAFAQAVAFSWMAQDMDRPLWRVDGIPSALVRFFPMWFALNLLILTCGNAAGRLLASDADNPFGQSLLLMFMMLQVIGIPICAAIMFHGKLVWSELAESLAPLGRQFMATTIVVVFAGCMLVLFLFVLLPATEEPAALRPLIQIPGGIAECVVFAGAFLICIMDRNAESQGDDFDF
jgi:hypothetical protein